MSRDPIGQNDQVNLYTYVANSPLKYTDRNGKAKKFVSLHDVTLLIQEDMTSGQFSSFPSLIFLSISQK